MFLKVNIGYLHLKSMVNLHLLVGMLGTYFHMSIPLIQYNRFSHWKSCALKYLQNLSVSQFSFTFDDQVIHIACFNSRVITKWWMSWEYEYKDTKTSMSRRWKQLWHFESVLSPHLPGKTGEYHKKSVRVALTFFPAILLLINVSEHYVRHRIVINK